MTGGDEYAEYVAASRVRAPLEALLLAALDAAFDGFALLTGVVDDDRRLVDFEFSYVNEVGAKLAGTAPAEMIGARVSRLWPSTVGTGLLARYLAVAETGETYLTEHTDAATGTVWELKATRVARDVVALSYRDVTSRVRQQEQVADSEAQALRAAGRMADLQAVTAALARAAGMSDVLGVMQAEVLSRTGADGLIVLLLEDDRLVVRHNTGYVRTDRLMTVEFATEGPAVVARAVRQREPLFFGSRADFLVAYPGHRTAVEASDKQAWAMLPLVSAGRVIGAMIVSYGTPHRFSREERELHVSVSELCAQALERAQLFEAQKSIAADLQRALLPAVLPTPRGARCAARYLPWTHGADVGGDWYDLIELDHDSVAVVIGDVAGHSTSAAATMGQIRNAIRAYALEGHSPTGVMARVNRLVNRLDPNALATCCYLELHLDEGTATGVLAGHPPPILRDGTDARPLDLRISMPLGASPVTTYVDTTVLLPARSSLLLYTDGLVEDRRYPIEVGLVDLCKVVAAAPVTEPDALADRVLSADVWPHPRTDDVALLAITTEGEPADWALRRFPGDASSAPSARRFAADLIVAWGLTALSDTAQLLLGEVITNAVQHTVGDVRVRVSRKPDRLRVEVTDGSDRVPDVRPIDLEAENGRGLFIVQALADEWGHESVETGGKTVWFELRTLQ
jgi:GAF domain-containing protein/anti-sigma regulatory factor (Ser/Thr protein kinase)